jgi:hypothetical protein
LNFVQNIFQIDPFLEERSKIRNSEIEIVVDMICPDDVRIWAAMMSLNIERVVDNSYKLLGNKIVRDVAIKYYFNYGEILNRREFILDKKEKFRIKKRYILTVGHKYKLMSLLRLYIDMYCESKYKNRIHISDLYVKL